MRPAERTGVLRAHWPEYLIEAGGLGAFMLSALGFTLLLEHPASPLRAALPDAFLRRALMGCAMGATLAALVYNPLGQRSGAHYNPAFTLTFWRLGKVAPLDALFYGAAQFAGAALGVALLATGFAMALGDARVQYAVTVPGAAGVATAFAAEVAIAFAQMLLVLCASNSKRLNRWTGALAAVGVATYITLEAPISGMSMNPARSLASALGAGNYTALWLYFAAPLLGMLAAAELYVVAAGAKRVHCAKFHHENGQRCIFRCRYGEAT
jgi:aquaporin Z